MTTATISDFEIMAPVGSRESLRAAIQAGAGSVYFGVGRLNMRAHSANTFTLDDLRDVASTCAAHGMKSYLTVNTIIYDGDMDDMHAIIDAACEAGVSAVIASDMAVITYCRSVGMEVHLSTQLNISNVEALRFYSRFADVAVLARELSLEQVEAIHRRAVADGICGPSGRPVRIEMFCHGALCMAVSGKCYLSLDNAARSANRGECMQLCRRSYTVTDNETGTQLEIDNKYIMSPKDLKTIRFIDRMMQAGVRVFKIEGRARGPEYVYTVVTCYREWNSSYGSAATERKVYVGRGVKYFSRLGVAEFTCEAAEFSVGDKMLVTGPTTGVMYVTADEIHDDTSSVTTARKGTRVSLKVPGKVRPSDKLFKIERVGK